MRVLFDTCVIIDAIQNRIPFYEEAQDIILLGSNHKFEGFLTAKSRTDIYYLSHQQTHSDRKSRDILSKLSLLFGILDTTGENIIHSLSSDISDFEDAVRIDSAIQSKRDCILTRNMKDYAKSPVPVYSPKEFLSLRKNK